MAEGDIIMYLNIFDSYLKIRSSHSDEKRCKKMCKDWCQKNYINYRVMEKVSIYRFLILFLFFDVKSLMSLLINIVATVCVATL